MYAYACVYSHITITTFRKDFVREQEGQRWYTGQDLEGEGGRKMKLYFNQRTFGIMKKRISPLCMPEPSAVSGSEKLCMSKTPLKATTGTSLLQCPPAV